MVNAERIRFSFLPRNTAHTRAAFSVHYEHVHGPLAAGLGGFRKHTLRYVQNHVLASLVGADDVDGITQTFQRPRADYTRGFFDEPDYALVQPDERYLFDIDRVVSVLSRPVSRREGVGTKLLAVLGGPGTTDAEAVEGMLGATLRDSESLALSAVDAASASALGFAASSFDGELIVETWLDAARAEAVLAAFEKGAVRRAWLVHEVEFFDES